MAVLAQPTTIALLAVMQLKGFGRRAALRIVEQPARETEPAACRDHFVARAAEVFGEHIAASGFPSEFKEAWDKSEEQLVKSQDAHIQVVSIYDPRYPSRLRDIPDPPAVLFVKGSEAALDPERSLAVVGTREPTQFGERVAQRCACTAAGQGFVVVSGLAHGCDVKAHEGCLEAGGLGLVVLAHGLDKVYPAPNRDLAARLLEQGGCLISEYPIFAKPSRLTFAERNRLQSGLADGVLVVETDVEGGTKHIIRYAGIQGRPLAAVQHPPKLLGVPKARGNQKIIQENGAVAIPDEAALLRFLSSLRSARMHSPERALLTPGSDSQVEMGF